MRIVLDSNILVRAFVNPQGSAFEVLQTILFGPHEHVISNEMLAELSRVLRNPRLHADTGGNEETVYEFVSWPRHSANSVSLNPLIVAPIRDLNDVIVLQTLLSGDADLLCTKDRDFFEPPASRFLAARGIAVLTDADLLHLLRSP